MRLILRSSRHCCSCIVMALRIANVRSPVSVKTCLRSRCYGCVRAWAYIGRLLIEPQVAGASCVLKCNTVWSTCSVGLSMLERRANLAQSVCCRRRKPCVPGVLSVRTHMCKTNFDVALEAQFS